jgi:hypothetical protein
VSVDRWVDTHDFLNLALHSQPEAHAALLAALQGGTSGTGTFGEHAASSASALRRSSKHGVPTVCSGTQRPADTAIGDHLLRALTVDAASGMYLIPSFAPHEFHSHQHNVLNQDCLGDSGCVATSKARDKAIAEACTSLQALAHTLNVQQQKQRRLSTLQHVRTGVNHSTATWHGVQAASQAIVTTPVLLDKVRQGK